MSATAETPKKKKTYRTVEVRDLDGEALEALSGEMKLSLSRDDMLAMRAYFVDVGRDPTDVELEVIAQTWSEHCKHRIFGAEISHTTAAGTEVVDGLFKTYVKKVTDDIMEKKPGFVLSAFHDNAGFVVLDDEQAACLKVETHNHPSAIEPYAGANTGLGGVIRDILGAGKGAKPVASLDVFCFGAPDTDAADIKGEDVIHPLGIMRGVVRGVRDYGNRMGIPTVGGAVQFDPSYIYNPLVFCGTAGVIPRGAIDKEVKAGHKVVAVGGRTGKDGLKGATFSSAALDEDSHEDDQQAVQIGNPIEEKKVADFILEARDRGLIEFVTDCGAGGFSSAAGEMLSEVGGELYLERAPLKEPGLISWEVFLSESQERMVLAVKEESLAELEELARIFETEMFEFGHADGSGILKVWHDGELVVELNCEKLHEAPRLELSSRFEKARPVGVIYDESHLGGDLKAVIEDFAVVSREPIIREYDHEVQGNTMLKPLAGATGDAPQDGSVFAVDGSARLLAMACSILPEWGKTDPYAMGAACVDETLRQLVCCGADPDRVALLDNFCVGNPHDPDELGRLVETCKGMADAAVTYVAPFVSGKDSFYNYFETEDGPVSIPVTLLASAIGVVEERADVTGASIRGEGNVLYLVGEMQDAVGGSVYARVNDIGGAAVPEVDCEANLARYRKLHRAIRSGLVSSAHDVSEGGLVVALAEMAYSEKAGVEVEIGTDLASAGALFSESPGCIVVEVSVDSAAQFEACFGAGDLRRLGSTSGKHAELVVRRGGDEILREAIS
ncbi:MAG: phosphoribosylformylglycinamidine synthase subunit PurL, partial [Verrucomicrobiales bacterium]|nr:phosphoribosylformylglycinamidine synthase subunit PurL [Verrucomicrobiales bacterium]